MPPLAIAAGIAAVGSIGGALIGAHSQKKAASQANAAQQQATQAQLQLGRESMALNKDIYNSNYDTLSPWVGRGNVAGDAYSALLGLPAAPAMHPPLQGSPSPAGGTAPAPGTAPASGTTPHPLAQFVGALNGVSLPNAPTSAYGSRGAEGLAYPVGASNAGVPGQFGGAGGVGGSPAPAPAPMPAAGGAPAGTPAPTPTPAPAGTGAQDAFNNFANSAGMQFQLKTGADTINNLYAARGALESGAAMKALQDYGQHTALDNYFMPYMGMLGGLSAQGAQAGSAIAGVGSNFGNTATAINGQMGQAIQGGADSASAAAIARGNANAQMWGNIGGALGNVASSFVPVPHY